MSRKQFGGDGIYTYILPFRNYYKNQNLSRAYGVRRRSIDKSHAVHRRRKIMELGRYNSKRQDDVFKYRSCHRSTVYSLVNIFDAQGKTTRWSREKRRKPIHDTTSGYLDNRIPVRTVYAQLFFYGNSSEIIFRHGCRPLAIIIIYHPISTVARVHNNNNNM